MIKRALKALISTVIEWNILDENGSEEDWSASSVLASVRIKKGVCYFSYSPRMRELLALPRMYAKINLYIQSRFHSNYGLALYENCVRYRNVQSTKWFDMKQFRDLMGVDEGKYKVFKDFKKRVIDKAVDEVNTYSDIKITPIYGRLGRRINKVRFSVKDRPKKARLGQSKLTMVKTPQAESLSEIIQSKFSLSHIHADKLGAASI